MMSSKNLLLLLVGAITMSFVSCLPPPCKLPDEPIHFLAFDMLLHIDNHSDSRSVYSKHEKLDALDVTVQRSLSMIDASARYCSKLHQTCPNTTAIAIATATTATSSDTSVGVSGCDIDGDSDSDIESRVSAAVDLCRVSPKACYSMFRQLVGQVDVAKSFFEYQKNDEASYQADQLAHSLQEVAKRIEQNEVTLVCKVFGTAKEQKTQLADSVIHCVRTDKRREAVLQLHCKTVFIHRFVIELQKAAREVA